ncbi:poly(U)-specific 3'-to-5' RNA exonuclease [Teratosphaeriaceae sp. CCFEE 6253]|nr:poly(U)-specific 3'-to-5' RNA exonuclease [Teratosphaeriaceae sp. CCFEE 6253]
MALVGYSDSEGDDADAPPPFPPAKKRKREREPVKALPPLPSTFRDLYSSTVRSSTQDDPALHGGRQRVTPHVEGHWPTHVYLEWGPEPYEYAQLLALIALEQDVQQGTCELRSLMSNELGVSLPLHISLSRPLVLRAQQRELFLDHLKRDVAGTGVRTFQAEFDGLRWHPNELGTRWFLVLQAHTPGKHELDRLLGACNTVATAIEQPLLYTDPPDRLDHHAIEGPAESKFHVSIAWSLRKPALTHHMAAPAKPAEQGTEEAESAAGVPPLMATFSDVKVRIGQDVSPITLPAGRPKQGLFT